MAANRRWYAAFAIPCREISTSVPHGVGAPAAIAPALRREKETIPSRRHAVVTTTSPAAWLLRWDQRLDQGPQVVTDQPRRRGRRRRGHAPHRSSPAPRARRPT